MKQSKQIVKRIIDLAMIVLLPLLMAEILIGQEIHEWLGTGMMVLFAVHHILNAGWWKSLFKGKYTPSRALSVTIDLLLLLDMAALGISGILMSDFVFNFLSLRGTMMAARQLHFFASYWGLILMSVHLGMHTEMFIRIGRKLFRTSEKNRVRAWILRAAAAVISIYGIYAFFVQQLPDYLFLQTHFVLFDETKAAAVYFTEIVSMIVLFAAIAYYLNKLLRNAGKGKEKTNGMGWKIMSFAVPVFVCLLCAVALLVFCFAECGQAGNMQSQDQENSEITNPDSFSDTESNDAANPVVYMTTDISSDGLMKVYEALEASPGGKIAVKLSTGEPGSNYLRTDLIGGLVQSFDTPAIVECNTAYGGARANTAMHYQVAEDHGYTEIADVDIMDENGSMTLPVEGGDNLTENYVGANFANYDYYVVLSHFKGHSMAGYGGAIKNISIGIASSEGKAHIHSGGTGGSMWGGDQDAFLESMAEAGKSVADYLDGNILYINVMNRLSVDCDCDGSPAEPDMHDIGILASFDPVAVDQACIDLVYAAEDGASLRERIESRNGLHTLEHAEKIGLGSRSYSLIAVD